MEVEEGKQLVHRLLRCKLLHQGLNRLRYRIKLGIFNLFLDVRKLAVHVFSDERRSRVANDDSFWVTHRDYIKVTFLSEVLCELVGSRKQKLAKSVDDPRRGSFAWMCPRLDHDCILTKIDIKVGDLD